MERAKEVNDRRLDLAVKAGERWNASKDLRAETVAKLQAGGPEAADSPKRVSNYHAREAAKAEAYVRAGVTTAFFTERRIGPTLDLDDGPPNEAARTAGMPVGRIGSLDTNGRLQGFATGFLIAPNLLITNHHVFAAPAECEDCGINFGFEKIGDVVAPGTVFRIDPSKFFFTDAELDFTVVGIEPVSTPNGTSLSRYGTLLLVPTVGKILVGQSISIIQYPDGGPKKYGVRDNELLIPPSDTDKFLQYSTDTLPGSSGSPAFNKDWEVVAIHHSGVPEIRDGHILTIQGTPWNRDMPDSQVHWIANEGVRVSCVCASLKDARLDDEHEPTRASLVATFHEDLSRLPALQNPQVPRPPVVATPAQRSGEAMMITVNGPANFYFGVTPAAVQTQRLASTAIGLPLPVGAHAALEKRLTFDPDYEGRPGYDENFLSIRVPMPGIRAERKDEILLTGEKPLILKYHHYSLVMNRLRRLQMWSAVNVNYSPATRRKNRKDFGTDTWVPDPRIPANLQIEDAELYDPAKKFDRGHIVRREDVAWGETVKEEIFANSDSFHWTNCTPQHEQFNRDKYGFHGLWGALENHIQTQAKNVGSTMSIFAGPVLDNKNDIQHDFGGGDVLVPTRFWKVLFVAEDANTGDAALRAYGFILDQQQAIDEYGLERFALGKFKTYHVTLAEISRVTGVTFDPVLLEADTRHDVPDERKYETVNSLEEALV